MAELDPQTKAEVVDYVKKEVLTKIPTEIEHLTAENVDALLSNLYVLRYYCFQKRFDPNVTDRLNNVIEISQDLWDLLDSNSNIFMYLKEMYKIRGLDLAANLLGQYEETTSGEDTLRDVILNSIGTFLFWKSDTVWVDVAKIDYLAPSKVHTGKIREEFWRIINESPQNGNQMTLEKASEIGEKMNLLLNFTVSDEIPAVGRALLLSTMYTLLLRLQIDKTVIAMQSNGE